MTDSLAPLAEWAVRLRLTDVPSEVLADARTQLLDAVGVIVGAASIGPVAALGRLQASAGPARFLGQGLSGTAEAAALVNGAAGTWLDYDSGQRLSGSHPAIHAVPAAIAVAEEVGASGADLLTAIVVGCEIGARIGVSAGRLRAGMSPHGGWAVIGAAAAASRLLGYSASETLAAINIASSLTLMSSTSTHTFGASSRHLQAGLGAQRGVVAARFQRDGMLGEPNGVQSVIGGFVTPSFNPRRAIIELGSRYEFIRGYYKPYACARFGHAAIDALLAIRDDVPAEPDAIESIEVISYGGAAGLTEVHPTRDLAAKFSLPHTLAAAWILGHAGPEAFFEPARQNPAIRALRERVMLREDTDYTAMAPEYRPARVTVRFRDGREQTVERLNARGENDDTTRDRWLIEKFTSLVAPRLGESVASQLRSMIGAIEQTERASELTALTDPV